MPGCVCERPAHLLLHLRIGLIAVHHAHVLLELLQPGLFSALLLVQLLQFLLTRLTLLHHVTSRPDLLNTRPRTQTHRLQLSEHRVELLTALLELATQEELLGLVLQHRLLALFPQSPQLTRARLVVPLVLCV